MNTDPEKESGGKSIAVACKSKFLTQQCNPKIITHNTEQIVDRKESIRNQFIHCTVPVPKTYYQSDTYFWIREQRRSLIRRRLKFFS
jgi:hypothetical protein